MPKRNDLEMIIFNFLATKDSSKLLENIVDCVTNPNSDTFDKLTKEYIERYGFVEKEQDVFVKENINVFFYYPNVCITSQRFVDFNLKTNTQIFEGKCQTTHDFDVIIRCLTL